MQILDMPYLCQWANSVAPGGTCNVTATAMAIAHFNIKGENGVEALPEELRHWIEDIKGGDRHDNDWLKQAIEWKGLKDDYRDTWTLNQIIAALASGKPVVLDTWLSLSGHYIVLKAYDASGQQFIVNDSNGEWFADGYKDGAIGESLRYSLNLILSVGLGADGRVSPGDYHDAMNHPSFAAHVISN